MFEQLSETLCKECGERCEGFFLAAEFDEYHRHQGPKIAWAVDGQNIYLRMANCKRLDRVQDISQFLALFGMTVVETNLVQ